MGATVVGNGEALPAVCGWTLTQVLPPDANMDEMGRVKVSSAQGQPSTLSVHVMAARGQAVGEQMEAKSASKCRNLGASHGCALAESPSFHAPSIAPWWAPPDQVYCLFSLVFCSSLNPTALNTLCMPKAEQMRGDAAGSLREAESTGESPADLSALNKAIPNRKELV